MADEGFSVVTGAFGYSGKYIARRLLAQGKRVRTLTAHPDRPNPFGDQVSVAPLDFAKPDELARSLDGAEVLYNTYWIRFAYGRLTFAQAIENSRILFRAAQQAGLRRIVHVSITNPSADSPLPYFSGKAEVEQALTKLPLTHAILRPTVIYGAEDILINNIAWIVRRFPVLAVPGSGQCRLQPVFVEDMAALAVEAGGGDDNVVTNAVGPEVFTFDELVRLIARTVGRKARLLHLPPGVALALSEIVGKLVGDVVLTADEVAGLAQDLLVVDTPPTGTTRLSDWLAQNAETVGRRYASELQRHFRS